MDSQLVVLHFASVADAEDAAATVGSLAAGGFIELEEGAILTRAANGTVTATSMDGRKLRGRTAAGGVIGLLTGGLLGLPGLGALLGAGVGATSVAHAEYLDELMFTVGHDMASGSAVLALLVRDVSDPQTVLDRLEVHRTGIKQAEIPADLRAHLEARAAEQAEPQQHVTPPLRGAPEVHAGDPDPHRQHQR